MKRVRQMELKGTKGWGGRRSGAGRPRVGTEVNHLRRQRIKANIPVHITMRLKPLSVSLRSKSLFDSFKRSAIGARKFGLNINQFSLMGNHLHLIAEAKDNAALT